MRSMINRIWLRTVEWIFVSLLLSVVHRRNPDLVLRAKPSPQLKRWHVIPKNRFFNIYLHHLLRNDEDRALHDHPWWNCTIILAGKYREVMVGRSRVLKTGQIVLRRAATPHRLETIGGGYAWSLFITGPKIREWGFHCPNGWVHWLKFVDPQNTGEVGRGCGV